MNAQTKDSTTGAATATLTKTELFERYLNTRVTTVTGFGEVVTTYVPGDLLNDWGYETLFNFIEDIADDIKTSDDPEEALAQAAMDLRQYGENLEKLLVEFRAVADALYIDVEVDEPNDPKKAIAWRLARELGDESPRYRAPEIEDAA